MPRWLLHVLLIALATSALLLQVSLSESESESPSLSYELEVLFSRLPEANSNMVVRFACLACGQRNGAPRFFTEYRAACVHYARSPLCNMSQKGIATVVLPNRPADHEAGGSGAAEPWTGPRRGVRTHRLHGQGKKHHVYHK